MQLYKNHLDFLKDNHQNLTSDFYTFIGFDGVFCRFDLRNPDNIIFERNFDI